MPQSYDNDILEIYIEDKTCIDAKLLTNEQKNETEKSTKNISMKTTHINRQKDGQAANQKKHEEKYLIH